jgi:hypothetical protein
MNYQYNNKHKSHSYQYQSLPANLVVAPNLHTRTAISLFSLSPSHSLMSHLVVLDPLDNLGTALLAVEHLVMLITQALLSLQLIPAATDHSLHVLYALGG